LRVTTANWPAEISMVIKPPCIGRRIIAHMKAAILIAQVASAADRANLVRQDPAVLKAAKQALTNVVQAGRSTNDLFLDTRAAWRRSDRRHP
jgi:hypothetical protein